MFDVDSALQAYHEALVETHRQVKSEPVHPKTKTPKDAPRNIHSWREQLVFDIVKEMVSLQTLTWLLDARPSTHLEDHAGIDLCVITDVGEVTLQVWASSKNLDPWVRSHPGCRAGVIKVPENYRDVASSPAPIGKGRKRWKQLRSHLRVKLTALLSELYRREMHVFTW